MQLSAQGLQLVKNSEGFRSNTYLDIAGLPTIGYGHRLVHPECYPGGITPAQACTILQWDLREAEQSVQRLVCVPLNQGQFDALVDFVFNLGSGSLARSTLLDDLNAGNYAAAAQQLLLWDHSGTTEVPALLARRQAEFRLFTGSPAEAAAAQPSSPSAAQPSAA
ncbi:MAG TPA: lysozyme [Terracidiphilus sp.]|nr:lysozyme [Terracidiphilus sp.]